jgi:IS605 OrfB family transposase
MKHTKVMRYQIIKPINDTWETLGHVLREIQRETRAALNKTIQLAWEWQGFRAEYKQRYEEYPKTKDHLGYSALHGYAYNRLKDEFYRMNTANLSQTVKRAADKWKSDLKDVMRGDKSIASFKKDCPIDIVSQALRIRKDGSDYILTLSLVSIKYRKELERKQSSFDVLISANDKTQRDILDRLIAGEYKLGASQLLYHKKKWFVNVNYQFEKEETAFDQDNIMGVDLGIVYPVYMAFNNSLHRYKIEGGEIERFRAQVERRKKQLLQQAKYCGEGRRGHGTKTRIQPIEVVSDKVANFRDTVNHRYSRYVVDMAIKHRCGTIQMEDLTGIATDNTFLKSWPYYDLQQKIEYKAHEAGIQVVYIKPDYTSQRCSKCGHIERDNRTEQATFECKSCGFKTNADFNAARNIATKDIEKIIAETLK